MRKNYFKIGFLLFGVLIFLFFLYLFSHFGEAKKIPDLLLRLKWYILIGVLVLQFFFLENRGQIFKVLYNRFGIDLDLKESFLLFLASNSINILAPSAGFSGIALYMSQAKRHGSSKTKIFLINVLSYFINLVSLSVMLVASFIYLFIVKKLNTYYLVSFAILIGIIILIILTVFLSSYFKKAFIRITKFAISVSNYFLKIVGATQIDHKSAGKLQRELIRTRKFIQKDKSAFFIPFFLFLLGNLYEIAMLYLIMLSFGATASFWALQASYSVGLLFMIVSFTPAGVGVVEPLMTVALTSLGTPLEVSALTVVIFRIVTFWLPLPFGTIAARKFLT